MEKLIQSTDPLLSLAGALFLLGASFDIIFSSQFKSMLKQLILSSVNAKKLSRHFLSTYSQIFVAEVLSYRRPLVFIAKSISLSLFCFVLISYIEAYHNQGRMAVGLQLNFFISLMLLVPPILSVVLSQMIFDVLSAYVSILYFDVIARTGRYRVAVLVLLSDLLVTSFLWAIFFSFVIALHVKVADLYRREANVGIEFSDIPAEAWDEESVYRKNKTLKDQVSVGYAIYLYDGEQFLRVNGDYIAIITNMPRDKYLADRVFSLINKTSGARQESPVKETGGLYDARISIRNLIGWPEFVSLVRFGSKALNTTNIIYNAVSNFGSYEFLSTERVYASVIDEEIEHNWVIGGDVVIFCDKEFHKLEYKAANEFDFTKCTSYVAAPVGAGKFMAENAGINFAENYLFSFKAFYWSSLAVTLAYYAIFALTIARYLARRLFVNPLVLAGLNLDKTFFTSIFTVGSAVCLLLFAIKSLVRLF